MNDLIKKDLILEGLSCASCAAKIEKEIRALPGVKKASVNFASQRLTIEVNDKNVLTRIIEEVIKITKRVEPGVSIIDQKFAKLEKNKQANKTEQAQNKKEVIRLGIGAILFIVALSLNLSPKMELSLYFISYLLVGGEIILRALSNIFRGQVFDENFLMSLATVGAFAIGEYPEGVAVMLFYQVGEFFQDLAVNRSRKSIADLMDIRPDYANLKLAEQVKKVSPEEVKIGDLIIIKPGEKVPLDGKVVEGRSMVDSSALTGESLPRDVEIGSEILGGFINMNGLLTVEVTKEFEQSTVSKILDLVENAGTRKAPTENFITKFARYYTPLVVLTALLIAIIPPLIIREAVFSDWLYRALIFLVISCPCALVVSIPLSFFGGIGAASKNGILIKGSNYLEALNNVDTVVFDKTGTLTKGIFTVTEIITADKITPNQLLEYAALAETYSNHPIAESILKAYGKEVARDQIQSYAELAGQGVKVLALNKVILAGNARLMEQENINYTRTEAPGTIIHLAVDGKYAGYLVISDQIKQDAKEAVTQLKQLGIRKTVLLTGDLKPIGEKVAKQLGLDEVYSELLPDQKVERLELLDQQKPSKGKLLFAGDGINDAPVLARADIGVAMGGLGSDAAIEAADVVIMTDEPSKIGTAVKIARGTKKIVWQNIVFSLGIKIIVLILGAAGTATMWQAVFADVGVSVIAVLNALRVLSIKL